VRESTKVHALPGQPVPALAMAAAKGNPASMCQRRGGVCRQGLGVNMVL